MPSSSSASKTHPASHAASALAMASVSHVMSHDTLPGPTLRPCSPWIRTASQANTAAAAPGSPGGSVVIAADKQQPTLAEALGFPDCAYFSSKPRLSAPASRQATRAAHTSSMPLAQQTQRGAAMHQGDPSTLRGECCLFLPVYTCLTTKLCVLQTTNSSTARSSVVSQLHAWLLDLHDTTVLCVTDDCICVTSPTSASGS